MKFSPISCVLAMIAFAVAGSRINPGCSDTVWPDGPGLTTDESFNVAQGVYLFQSAEHYGPLLFTPNGARDIFGSEDYLPDHPPAGRVLIGAAHELFGWLIPGSEGTVVNLMAARLAGCFALGLTVLALTEWSYRTYGLTTAFCSGLMLILMPQFMGHARLATLEISTALAWLMVTICLANWWTGSERPSDRQAIVTGLFWGLLMLTKMQGILYPPVIAGWAFYRFRWQAFRPLILCALSGLALMFICWPWLWLDPQKHFLEYLNRASERSIIYVWYLGQRFADRDVPWHYPLIMTLVTLPGIVMLGFGVRLFRRALDPREILLLISAVWPIVIFSLPGTPVYDGTRLFLCSMPALAMLAGRGAALAIQSRRNSMGSRVSLVAMAFLTIWLLASGSLFSPFAISYYSELAGGPSGAQRLGMEASFWGDALNGEFWNAVPEGSTILVAPVLHGYQLADLETMVPIVAERKLKLLPFLYDPTKQKGLMLCMHRLADLRKSLQTPPEGARVLREVRYDGVVLARLMDTTDATWTETP
jgi:4-amino-4-deoxy-L-arabinose transferase-like glycosyltransferase